MLQLTLRRAHRASALRLVAFVCAHIGNHLWALRGAAAHIELMDGLRLVYRHRLVEPVLLASAGVQCVSGWGLVVLGWRRRTGWVAWLQAASVGQRGSKRVKEGQKGMANFIAWALFALGIAHIAFGLVRFRTALTEACAAGFIGQFKEPEIRRSAFWFLMCGPLLMLTGQVAVHAVAMSDLWLLKVIGAYLLVTCAVGVAAFPKSPLWAPLMLSFFFILAGYGVLG